MSDNSIPFSTYLKSRDSNPEDLLEKLNAQDKTKSQKGPFENQDPRYFKYSLDKASTSLVMMRFLPQKSLDVLPILNRFKHNYQHPITKRWYMDFCPTIDGFDGQPCPMCAENGKYFNDDGPDKGEYRRKVGIAAAKEEGMQRSRRKEHLSCVLILQDSVKPENNGKVFIWNYGERVYQKIQAALNPSENDRKLLNKKPIPVFDLFKGANFVLNIYKKDGQPQYDRCEFQSPSALFDGDEEKLKVLWDSIIDLSEFDSHKFLKPKADLYKRYDYVMGVTNTWGKKDEQPDQKAEEKVEQKAETKSEPKIESKQSAPSSEPSGEEMTDEAVENFFK